MLKLFPSADPHSIGGSFRHILFVGVPWETVERGRLYVQCICARHRGQALPVPLDRFHPLAYASAVAEGCGEEAIYIKEAPRLAGRYVHNRVARVNLPTQEVFYVTSNPDSDDFLSYGIAATVLMDELVSAGARNIIDFWNEQ